MITITVAMRNDPIWSTVGKNTLNRFVVGSGGTVVPGFGSSSPVSAIKVQMPKTIDKRYKPQANVIITIALRGVVEDLIISLAKVIVIARMPVERVINCFVRSPAKSKAFFLRSSISLSRRDVTGKFFL